MIIKKLTAFVSVMDNGNEGIIGMKIAQDEWMPFVCANEEKIKQLLPLCDEMCNQENITYRILQFENRTDITDEIKKKFL